MTFFCFTSHPVSCIVALFGPVIVPCFAFHCCLLFPRCREVHIVLPVLYGDESFAAFSLRVIAVVILLEILVNWLCVRFVTSSYRPEVDRRGSRDRRWPMRNGGGGGVVSGCQDVDDGDDETETETGFEIDLAQLRASKPEVGGNGVSETISGSVYSLPVSGMRNLGAGADRAWRRGDTIYVVSGHGDDGTRMFDPAVAAARRNGGRPVGCRKVVYPYWSSKPCAECRHRRPPRAHHCRYCGSCVLKRDHHCLLVGRCVGLRNQRHFVVFVFWSTRPIFCSALVEDRDLKTALFQSSYSSP